LDGRLLCCDGRGARQLGRYGKVCEESRQAQGRFAAVEAILIPRGLATGSFIRKVSGCCKGTEVVSRQELRCNAPVTYVNLAGLYVKLALQHYKQVLQHRRNPALQAKFNRLQQVLHDGVVTQTKRRDIPLPEDVKVAIPEKKQ